MANVTLEWSTPLVVCATAIRTAWESFDKSDGGGEADRALIERVGNKFKHSSTLEHLTYTFFIEGISRALLQELSRHRKTSPTVKSTRYTLKELREEQPFVVSIGYDPLTDSYFGTLTDDAHDRAEKYLVMTNNRNVNFHSIVKLDMLRVTVKSGVSNDISKYELPEAYKTNEMLTINARSLQNFLSLRSDKSALWEIRELALSIFNALPEDHKYLFEHCIKE